VLWQKLFQEIVSSKPLRMQQRNYVWINWTKTKQKRSCLNQRQGCIFKFAYRLWEVCCLPEHPLCTTLHWWLDQVYCLDRRAYGCSMTKYWPWKWRGSHLSLLIMSKLTTQLNKQLCQGKVKLVYISPESLTLSNYWEMMYTDSYQKNLTILAVDEAHCILTW